MTTTLVIIGAGILALAWLIHRVHVAAHKTSPAGLEAAMRSGYEASPFTRRPIPGVTTEHVTPLDPADLPTVTNDDEALEAMMRLALAERVKTAIEKKEKGQ